MAGPPALSVTDLRRTFGGVVAVDRASFEIPDGSVTGLIGPNGAGKSTVFDLVTGVLDPDGGTVDLYGEAVTGLSPDEMARRGVGRTFQTPRTFPGMTVRENLAFAAPDQTGERALGALLRPGRVGSEEAALADRVAETLDVLDLDHLADEYARGLSGGQRKLLELGRVLMLDPDLLMLDEPAAGVNPALAERLFDRVRALNDDGVTVLLIEHDIGLVVRECDHLVVLHDGRRLASGAPEAVRRDERVVEAYVGGGAGE